MGRFIIVTFLFMGFAFYQLSGGSDFDAEAKRQAHLEAIGPIETTPLEKPAKAPVEPVALELAKVDEVLAPKRTRQLIPARVREPVQDASIVEAVAEALEEEPEIILPSLVNGADASVTPVDFSGTASAEDEALSTRTVSGNRVNVRGGPGTDFQIVNRLVRGDEVEILEDPGNGWVMLRPVGGGTVGWMADFLLSDG